MTQRSAEHVALGAALREARHAKSLSQERLADLCDLDRTYVGGIERGERNPGYANLLRLAAALDVPLSAIVARAERLRAERR
jgi:transcriptional regulator with XRE-family HTH domain